MPGGRDPLPLHTYVPQMSHCSLLGLQQLASWGGSPNQLGSHLLARWSGVPAVVGDREQLPEEAGAPASRSVVCLDTV